MLIKGSGLKIPQFPFNTIAILEVDIELQAVESRVWPLTHCDNDSPLLIMVAS